MDDQKESPIDEIIEKLSPMERKVLPFLKEGFYEVKKKSGLDEVSLVRALRFLENKGILKIKTDVESVIDLGTNGIYYKKHQLPERTLLLTLEKHNHVSLEEARKFSKLSENEFKVSLGILKGKALISLTNGKINLSAEKDEIIKKSLEEQLLHILPIEQSKLAPEQLYALESLKKRKDIVEIKPKKTIHFTLTETGKIIAGREIKLDLIEEVTPEIISNWSKGKKFRKYDISANVPRIYGGKKHFVNQSVEYAKKIWLDMGFKEMNGNSIDSSFWVFDALFTPQDHPARDMQDTFFIKDVVGELPDSKLVKEVKKAHETGVAGSKGWNYSWTEKEAKRLVLRTHTTAVSARTLANLKKSDLPSKFFAIGKCFRNEAVDWSHGFEFNQTEGIVIDRNANFRHLLGYLKEFFTKMGMKKIRFLPCYYPYTEPSVEISVWHPEKKVWLEIGGAGIFRPEVVIPLFGEYVPVLAWGPGFDRVMMDYYKIADLRELYSNDIRSLREKKFWIK